MQSATSAQNVPVHLRKVTATTAIVSLIALTFRAFGSSMQGSSGVVMMP